MPKTKHWKPVAVFSAFAVVLSVLVSSLSGVSAGIVIVRALIWGSVFALLGFSSLALIGRYLPGLLPAGRDDTSAQQSETGGTIDITLDGDTSPTAGGGGLETDFSDFDGADDGGSYAVDVQEVDSEDQEDIGVLETVDSDDSDARGYSDESDGPESDGDSGLPSMDGLSESFGQQDGTLSTLGSKHKLDLMGTEEDPESIAKAVRTLLKRDQEG